MYTIGIDIGGMSIKVGVVDSNGKILLQSRVKTAPTATQCVDNMAEQIKSLLEDLNISINDIDGIGIGCPGAVTSETGIVISLQNRCWHMVS